jgi:hypothetical protein
VKEEICSMTEGVNSHYNRMTRQVWDDVTIA